MKERIEVSVNDMVSFIVDLGELRKNGSTDIDLHELRLNNGITIKLKYDTCDDPQDTILNCKYYIPEIDDLRDGLDHIIKSDVILNVHVRRTLIYMAHVDAIPEWSLDDIIHDLDGIEKYDFVTDWCHRMKKLTMSQRKLVMSNEVRCRYSHDLCALCHID